MNASDSLPTVLLTGFDPFGGESVNPSWQAVHALDGQVIEGHRVTAVQLPTAFKASLEILSKALDEHAPRVVVAVGQAGGRDGMSLERVAINVNDARIPDNAGDQPVDMPVVADGPAAYFTRLPIKAALQALTREGIAAHVSQTAGTYVCNHVFYGLMHALRNHPDIRGGFVHVPWSPQQAAQHQQPGMALDMVERALSVIVATTLITHDDVRMAAGAEC